MRQTDEQVNVSLSAPVCTSHSNGSGPGLASRPQFLHTLGVRSQRLTFLAIATL